MNKVIIVIPAYKEVIDFNEQISIRQCFKILNNYPVAFVHPEQLNMENYQAIAEKSNVHLENQKFESLYFENIDGYNKLLLSVDFYRRFENYEYIFIYQPDCFVFRDELDYWCNKEYDYIGAPWVNIKVKEWFQIPGLYPFEIKLFHRLSNFALVKKVGNGGLSLRKTKSFIRNLSFFHKRANGWKANEDSFFSHYLGTFNPFFKIPSFKVALNFSFDAFPHCAYKLNNYRLPFACHAWYRNVEFFYSKNYSFWKPFIQAELGHDLEQIDFQKSAEN